VLKVVMDRYRKKIRAEDISRPGVNYARAHGGPAHNVQAKGGSSIPMFSLTIYQ
jgi:hypothetical protein